MAKLLQSAATTIRNCGLILALFGLLAIFLPNYLGMTIGVLVGLFLFFGGLLRVIFAWAASSWGSASLRFAFGVLAMVAGGIMVAQPNTALRFFIIVAIVYFIVDGVSAILFALRLPPAAGGAPMILSGIVSLALGVMLWRNWPLPGEQMLGIYIGVKLLIDGIVMLVIGRGARAIDEALTSQEGAPTKTQ